METTFLVRGSPESGGYVYDETETRVISAEELAESARLKQEILSGGGSAAKKLRALLAERGN